MKKLRIYKVGTFLFLAMMCVLLNSHYALAASVGNWIDNANTAETSIKPRNETILPTVDKMKIVTGSQTGTYFRFGNDIKDAIIQDGVEIEVKNSKGSIDNISQIGTLEAATLGIVQSDVLGFLKRSTQPESKKLAHQLRMIFPFYQEEVHLIANKTISSFGDLNGKTVVVGSKGSGSWLTSINLFGITGIRPTKMLRLSPEKGLVAVLSGKADAMIFVAGKPVKLFKNLDALADIDKYSNLIDNIHMVSIIDDKILREYSISTISNEDYDFVKEPVTTVAVTAVLVSFDYSGDDSEYATRRCSDINSFSRALISRIDEIKISGHSKWQEVDLTAEIGLWERDKCAEIVTVSSTLEDEMLDTMSLDW